MQDKTDDSLVSIANVTASPEKSAENSEAVLRVMKEFDALTLGKNEMTTGELHELKLYAKKRTDLSKPDDELLPDQMAWKLLYKSIDDAIASGMSEESKANIDKLQAQMDSATELKDAIEKMLPIGREIESEMMMQRAGISVYFDKEDNKYKLVVDGVTSDMVKEDKWSPAERVEKATLLLKIIEAQRENLYKIQVLARHEVIHTKIQEFEKAFKHLNRKLAEAEVDGDEAITALTASANEWLQLTKELYTSRTHAVSAIKNSLESDEFIPKLVIKDNGDISGTITTTDTFFQQMSAVVALINQASEEENKIAAKRDELSLQIFGKPEDYMNLGKADEPTAETQAVPESTGMGTKTKWFLVIALSIVALAWGIWTAIGVFVLGVIIINLLKS